MWRFRQWVGRAVGTAALAMVSVPTVGFTEQPLTQLPEVVEVIKDQGPLAGVSWSVIKDSDQSVERQAPMVIGQHVLARRQARPSPAWLDLHGGRSRAVNREPDLWRHEF
ncbi:MAG: hypothetical protein A3D28_05775 [Omnitrophica bacterium RIFCSPHIGHO2_02_FULL_63_14]|nr:MAG: hypothetical protein A3D28_05775 [Omnitrophica bacterium RIFCSPHIGHO2_02_FULL_63_14]